MSNRPWLSWIASNGDNLFSLQTRKSCSLKSSRLAVIRSRIKVSLNQAQRVMRSIAMFGSRLTEGCKPLRQTSRPGQDQPVLKLCIKRSA